MKILPLIFSLLSFAILVSCSDADDPEYPVFMQPSSITATDANRENRTFEYDEYGRVVTWTLKSTTYNVVSSYIAHYDYSGDNTIRITSEESTNGSLRHFEETIQLIDGRATESEGTFIHKQGENDWELHKTYRLSFEYDPSGHLTVVRHSEVVGIGDEINDNAWNKVWTWENYLVWEDGNLKEFQDFRGKSSVYQTTRYDYFITAVEYPVIIPLVINNIHHSPLYMQGVFGLNSINLVRSASVFDDNDNLYLSRRYSYVFENARIVEFEEMISDNVMLSSAVQYAVNWTAI